MDNQLKENDFGMQELIARVSEQPDGTYPLYDVWQRLTLGQWQAVHAVCREATCYLILREPSRVGTPVRGQRLRVLERMLHGHGQKSLALDLGVACSTVASTAKQALAGMGLDCVPSRVPLALVVVAHASEDYSRSQTANFCAFTYVERPHFIIRLMRPDRHLATLLPPAEVEVMKARIEGQPHELIAYLRRTSQRTIANQLASASRRLGVSGRFEIIGHLSQQSPMIAPLH
jgi:DNA-binding CsgD family transcriptional regulator